MNGPVETHEITNSPFVLLSAYEDLERLTRRSHTERPAQVQCR
jgi:hypothetical protein